MNNYLASEITVLEKTKKKKKVHFLIWTNFLSLEKRESGSTSPYTSLSSDNKGLNLKYTNAETTTDISRNYCCVKSVTGTIEVKKLEPYDEMETDEKDMK